MVVDTRSCDGEDDTVTAGCLRRMLYDLEAGRIVRVALDLQALIQEIERHGDGDAAGTDREAQSVGGVGASDSL
jgi:hypothetical protein